MDKDQAIKHAQNFDQELEILRKKYGISAGVFIGFYDTSHRKNGYPLCVYGDNCADFDNEQPGELCRLILHIGAGIIKNATGKSMIHEYYSGFNKKKP